MSTQSIAVETMVVAALKDLFADELELENMLDQLRHSTGGAKPEALFDRVLDLNARARRIEKLLDAMDRNDPSQPIVGIC